MQVCKVGLVAAIVLAGCAPKPRAAFQARYDAAQRYAAAGDSAAAIAAYRDAIRLNPASPATHNNLGALLYDIGQTEAALLEYERALQLDADFPEARNNLGVALLSTSRTAQAVAQFRHAVERKPSFGDARFNLCLGLEILDQIDEALKQCLTVAESQPSRPGLPEAIERLQRKLAELGSEPK
jgi:Flp pilus assembly protein TadD